MKKISTLIVLILSANLVIAQPTLAGWTMEGVTVSSTAGTSPSITGGSATADVGVQTGGSSMTGLHASASTVWSTPSGNGTSKSISSNNWAVGDYYQFQVSTSGYTGISLTWEQMGSGTGPGQWKLQYSTNGTTFTDFTTYTLPNITSWNPTTPNPGSVITYDLSSVTALNNASTVYFRLVVNGTTSVNGGTVASAGSGRVDNFTVKGFTVFPVKLISFTATHSNKSVSVNWTATSEINLDGYEVQRSVNGKDFMPVSLVQADGAVAATKNYSFVDQQPVAGLSYYRLKMNDKDGSFQYSAVASVKIQSIGVSVYPNPVKSLITVQHEAATAGAVIAILDLAGKQTMSVKVEAGAVQTSLNAARLAPGSYLVVYNNNGTRTTKQFIKE